MTGRSSRRSGSRASIQNPVRRVLWALSLSRNPMPPRTTRKSDRRKVSDRTMVGTVQPVCLSASGTERRRYGSTMNPRRGKTYSVSLHYRGWTANTRCFAVAGEAFVLTSPFIERDSRNVAPTALVYTVDAMGEKIRSKGSENSLHLRIRLISRIVIALNWLVILSISFLHRVPRSVALGAFTVFRDTAVCASLWLLFEIAGTRRGYTTIQNLLIDAALVLSMFGFWLLVAAANF